MITLYENQPVSARVRLTDDDYLRTRYYLHPDGTADITVGRGRDWTVLACKECYGKAVKTVLTLLSRTLRVPRHPSTSSMKQQNFEVTE